MELPASERLLLGPGPSPVSPRVLRAMGAPVLSHLDPDLLALMDELRGQLQRTFRAPEGSFALAVSGTGTTAMECAVANLVTKGTRVVSLVGGYFADRLAQMCARHEGQVLRLETEWGRACDPEILRRALADHRADLVTVVHAETSTGVLNPVAEVADLAREHGALSLVDAVTSYGAHPLDLEAWGVDACYSCAQKGIGAPSGLAPLVFTPRAMAARVTPESYALDLGLLEDYWVRRKYHHTLCASLVYALREALTMVEEEGLEPRWARHQRNHLALADGLKAMGLDLLPPPTERLWTLNAVRVPEGVDEAAARKMLLQEFNLEIGAGLGPLAGRIWRVGFMGAGSTPNVILLFLAALEAALRRQGFPLPPGAGTAAALGA
jgi:alanine-glyoxylate transaminase / serine-glyoxylate transaminase / serine-pyruvate transaminase